MSSPPPLPNPYTTTPISNPKMRLGAASTPSPPSSSSQQQQQPQQHQAKKPRMHPLRQTSFPASEDSDPRVFTNTNTNTARSDIDTGSVTGSFTGSLDGITGLVGGGGGNKKKGKGKGRTGRPRKNKEGGTPTGSAKGSVVDGGAGSVVDGDAGSSVKGGAGDGGSRVGGEEEEEEEEDDIEGQLFEGEGGMKDTEAEKKNLAVLIDAFDSAQSSRYNMFKRSKLRKETLRKTVNHVLSQSVPPSVVTTVNGYTKLFIGEIVEKARTVQREWADAYDQLLIEVAEAEAAKAMEPAASATSSGNASADTSAVEKQPPEENMKQTPTPNDSFLFGIAEAAQQNSPYPPVTPSNVLPNVVPDGMPSSTPQTPNPAPTTTPHFNNLATDTKPFRLPPNPHRGQLLPSHIREAHRRYKLDGEGGGVGYSGLSLKGLGTKGAVTCSIGGVGGKRLFR